MSPPLPVPSELYSDLSNLKSDQFTGKLVIQPSTAPVQGLCPEWSLYFCLGRLFWASDNLNRNRRVLHHLSRCCPQLKQRKFALRQNDNFDCINYTLLFVLLRRKVLEKEIFSQIVESVVQDTLFDVIHYQGTQGAIAWTVMPQDPLDILKMAATPLNNDRPWNNAIVEWAEWAQVDLGPVSPNHALVVKEAAQLQAKLGEATYQKLAIALDGRNSIRAIAQRLGQSPSQLMHSLRPYIKRKLIGVRYLKDEPDLVILSREANTRPRSRPRRRSRVSKERRSHSFAAPVHNSVVACIDDSPQICQIMTSLVQEAGYDIFCIQDSTQALPKLLERKPQLIFLDLLMPVANGYEICSQIRRIAAFRQTPIVILTGSDGIIDRVRAKVVGATDFLGKPVDPDKILRILNQYLRVTDSPLPSPPPLT